MDYEFEITKLKIELDFFRRGEFFRWLVCIATFLFVIFYFAERVNTNKFNIEKNNKQIDSLKNN